MGTVNVLEAARSCDNLKSIVSVTTDKCYENKEIQGDIKKMNQWEVMILIVVVKVVLS